MHIPKLRNKLFHSYAVILSHSRGSSSWQTTRFLRAMAVAAILDSRLVAENDGKLVVTQPEGCLRNQRTNRAPN